MRNLTFIISYEKLPLDDESDDVDLLDELLYGVLELAVAGDEGGPELTAHHPLPHPGQLRTRGYRTNVVLTSMGKGKEIIRHDQRISTHVTEIHFTRNFPPRKIRVI